MTCFGAQGPTESEEEVRRTEQPVLMGRVEFDPAAVLQDLRTSYQRDIVEMDDVKALRKDPADLARLEKRETGLVSGKGG